MISLTMPLKSLKILNRSSFLIHLAFYQTLAIFFFFLQTTNNNEIVTAHVVVKSMMRRNKSIWYKNSGDSHWNST